MSSIMNRKFTQILFGSVLFEVMSSVQLRQLRLCHGTPAAAAERGASEISLWWPRDERCRFWHCKDVEKGMCLFFGIHAYACIRDMIYWYHAANQQIGALGVLEFSFDFLNPVTKTKCSVLIQFWTHHSCSMLSIAFATEAWKEYRKEKGGFKSRTWMKLTCFTGGFKHKMFVNPSGKSSPIPALQRATKNLEMLRPATRCNDDL